MKKPFAEYFAGIGAGMVSYSVTGIAAQLVQMGCTLVILRWVPPAQMGIWLALQTAEACALFLRLGVINAMNREYPFLLGQDRADEAIRHVQTAGAYLAGCAGLMAAGFGGAAFFYAERGPDWQLAFGCFAVQAAAAIWRSFLEATFRGGQDFRRLARVQMLGMVLQLVSLPLVIRAGFEGFCARAVILAVVLTGVCHLVRPVRAAPLFDRAIFGKLLREGLPLFIANYLSSVAGQFPRLLLLYAGGAALLGLFAPVAALLAVGALIPGVLLTYLQPRQNYKFGRSGGAKAIAERAWRQAITVSAVLLPLGLIGYVALNFVVTTWLPQYSAALPALGYAAAIAVFSPLRLATSVFSTLRAWTPMLVHVGIGFVLAATLPWAIWQLGDGEPLVAVMQGTLLAQLVHAVAARPCVQWAVRTAVEPAGTWDATRAPAS